MILNIRYDYLSIPKNYMISPRLDDFSPILYAAGLEITLH